MTDAELFRETEDFFYEQIPLTRAMGVRVESYDQEKLILTAPLEANHNHLGTAFGGILSAVSTLAGYGLLWLLLGDRKAHIVIRKSSIDYRHPVRGTIRAICNRPDAATVDSFKTKFAELGKARITLAVTIQHEGEVCVDFEGVYIAIK